MMLEIRAGEGDVLHLVGRLDASQVERARKVIGPIDRSMVLDMTGLEYISSAGIELLIQTYKRLSDSGRSLRLSNPNNRVRSVLNLSGLDKVFVID